MKPYFCVVLLATTAAAIGIDHLTSKLQPVQSLYVKPSADGSTGDLYVAASEDSGISRWLTDNPVNFLNQAAMALKSATIMPTTLSPGFVAANPFQEESVTENKTASHSGLSSIFGSSQIGAETKKQLTSKPAAKVEIVQKVQPSEISSAAPALSPFQYSPYQFMYPSLFAAAVNDQKEAEEKDVYSNAALAQAQAAYWPNAAYSYATYPYMMMDPRFWAWAQAAAAANQAPANIEEASADENLRENV